ncbi:MAG: hypothetical protein IT324_05275 [Anaerolineae bacterium]|nr:hypothetical protein [Anaerolineae bacterium]
MGTLAIVRALLFHIQSESDPIYRGERRMSVIWRGPNLSRWGGWLFALLVISLPVLTLLERQLGIQWTAYRGVLIQLLLTVGGSLLSIGWTVPVTVLAGQGVSRERTAQTWDLLLTLPPPTETVLMAKAAARIQPVWQLVVSLAFILSLIGVFVVGPLIIVRTLAAGESLLWGGLSMVVGMVVVVAEREQEIALAAVIGLAVAFVSDSERLALLGGLFGGVLIRLAQLLIAVLLTLLIVSRLPEGFAPLGMIAGTAVVLIAAPGLVGIIGLIAVLGVREALIRILFSWLIRRAREA